MVARFSLQDFAMYKGLCFKALREANGDALGYHVGLKSGRKRRD